MWLNVCMGSELTFYCAKKKKSYQSKFYTLDPIILVFHSHGINLRFNHLKITALLHVITAALVPAGLLSSVLSVVFNSRA